MVRDALLKLPSQSVRISIQGLSSSTSKEWMQVKLQPLQGPVMDSHWLPVSAGSEYMLLVQVSHRDQRHSDGRAGSSVQALAPHYPKPKDESWFLVLGDRERKELVALKRTGSMRASCRHHVCCF
ncbi:hypothetical protein HPB51_015562 [Rhipicephalus microplus]|uniref:Uncharacterized protein n=1 Tax=Rhipicephalus microplus TaxID=6941 RepID=A0A9J6DHG2_RHIMP|nr:hypothetical protein HPB51_015562 [Rhipicephalus microplus]